MKKKKLYEEVNDASIDLHGGVLLHQLAQDAKIVAEHLLPQKQLLVFNWDAHLRGNLRFEICNGIVRLHLDHNGRWRCIVPPDVQLTANSSRQCLMAQLTFILDNLKISLYFLFVYKQHRRRVTRSSVRSINTIQRSQQNLTGAGTQSTQFNRSGHSVNPHAQWRLGDGLRRAGGLWGRLHVRSNVRLNARVLAGMPTSRYLTSPPLPHLIVTRARNIVSGRQRGLPCTSDSAVTAPVLQRRFFALVEAAADLCALRSGFYPLRQRCADLRALRPGFFCPFEQREASAGGAENSPRAPRPVAPVVVGAC